MNEMRALIEQARYTRGSILALGVIADASSTGSLTAAEINNWCRLQAELLEQALRPFPKQEDAT